MFFEEVFRSEQYSTTMASRIRVRYLHMLMLFNDNNVAEENFHQNTIARLPEVICNGPHRMLSDPQGLRHKQRILDAAQTSCNALAIQRSSSHSYMGYMG